MTSLLDDPSPAVVPPASGEDSPAGESSIATANAPVVRRVRRKRRPWWQRLLITIGGLLLVAIVGLGGVASYLLISEWRDPSGRVYIEVDGQRQYLEQPSAIVTPRPAQATVAQSAPLPTPPHPTSAAPVVAAAPAPPATVRAIPAPTGTIPAVPQPQVPLPPLNLTIAAIGVDTPIVLADNQHLPRIKVAGWLFKSAFPATAGNMVILGHVNGEAETFARLHELRPGDTIRITTANAVHIYVVDELRVVDESAVEVLAPTGEAVATLITCAGEWNPATRSFDQRLVVRAHYAAVEPR